MNNFYFTFGSDSSYPFFNGYIIIKAKTLSQAAQIFNVLYPNPKNANIVNCAFFYEEEDFNSRCRKYYTASDCHGVIDTTLKQSQPSTKGRVLYPKPITLF